MVSNNLNIQMKHAPSSTTSIGCEATVASAIPTSVACPPTATTTVEARNIGAFCRDLGPVSTCLDLRDTQTLSNLPRKRELSIATAASTCSGSANSTYAYLQTHEKHSVLGVWHIPFWMTGEPVAEDSDAVDHTTGLEMSLDFFWCGTIVDLRDMGQGSH